MPVAVQSKVINMLSFTIYILPGNGAVITGYTAYAKEMYNDIVSVKKYVCYIPSTVSCACAMAGMFVGLFAIQM